MSTSTQIEWTDATWNPVTGCTKITRGCDFCYAERFSERFRGTPGHPYEQGFDLTLWPSRLALPYTWKRPRQIFVNSMSDLFQEKVPVTFIQDVFRTMRASHWHEFQVLTKRSHRLLEVSSQLVWTDNIWMGVSVENEKYLYRIDHLRETGAHVKFLSLEPLLGPLHNMNLSGIDWAIAGGESGPGARPVDPAWVTLSPNKKFLYTLHPSAAQAIGFSIDPLSGRLTRLPGDTAPAASPPSHLAVDATGRFDQPHDRERQSRLARA